MTHEVVIFMLAVVIVFDVTSWLIVRTRRRRPNYRDSSNTGVTTITAC
jgi:hypothetical protein